MSPSQHPLTQFLRRTVLTVLVLGIGLISVASTVKAHGDQLLYDFRGGLYNAGVAILHGLSPYQPGFLAHQASLMRGGHLVIGETVAHLFSIPVYPAIANVAVSPLSALPFWLAGSLFTVLSLGAMLAGLWLLGVRDWRCLAVAGLSWPFLFGLFLGTIGPFLVLGAGAAWHWRNRVWPPALALALIIAVKVFPWPMAGWLLITRRFRAFAACAVAGLALTVGAWALIGFRGLLQYPQMLSDMSFIQENRATSLVAVLVNAGVPSGLSSAIAILAGGLILFAAWRVAAGPLGDRRAFGLAVLAALTATPIVWDHYMVLLFVPIALASPRFSLAWLLPAASPLLELLLPTSPSTQAFSERSLAVAILWLVLEALTALILLTTAEQRQAVWTRLRLRRSPLPVAG